MKTEKIIDAIYTTTRMLEIRDNLKVLYGDGYYEKIVQYQRFIKGAMIKHNLSSKLEAAIKLIEEVKDEYGGDMATLNIIAAYVELGDKKEL